MKGRFFSITTVLILISTFFLTLDLNARENFEPYETFIFEEKDGVELYMDMYSPEKGSETTFEGHQKPTIVFVFGGGFKWGKRDDNNYKPWFKTMTEQGYKVISIDYRLGLKDCKKVGIGALGEIHNAVHMAVKDLFSATKYIIDNAKSLDVDPNNLVISGSSAGAITALQADYELSNHSSDAKILPKGFKFAGVMAFSGAILSRHGKVKYASEPAPTLFLHGTKDKVVTYKSLRFFNWGFFGAHKLAKRFKKANYSYNILRYLGHGHDIAESMNDTVPEQLTFLENNVMKGNKRIVDSIIDDPELVYPEGSANLKELYSK